MARKVYCATNIGRSIVKRVVRLQRNGFPENRPIKNGKNILVARKYVALCFVLHHFGHDKATSVEQNTDKRYINARAYL